MVYKFFDKKSAGGGILNNNNNNNNNNSNNNNDNDNNDSDIKQNRCPLDSAALQLAKELHKQLLENFKKEKFILDLEIIFGVLIWLICN